MRKKDELKINISIFFFKQPAQYDVTALYARFGGKWDNEWEGCYWKSCRRLQPNKGQ